MSNEKTAVKKLLYGKWQYTYNLEEWHKHIEGYSIDGCAALSESRLAFVFRKESDDDRPDIKLLRFYRDDEKKISGKALIEVPLTSNFISLDKNEALWVSNLGHVFRLQSNNAKSDYEKNIPGRDDQFGYKVVRGLDRIGKNIFAACSWRHVFKRVGKSKWRDISENIDRSDLVNKEGAGWLGAQKTAGKVGFNSVGGTSDKDIYAGGDGGDCWYFDGNEWYRLELPTNHRIYKIIAKDEENVYMACGGGVLLKGSKDAWRIIGKEDTKDNILQMVLFKNDVYISTQFNMYKIVGDSLEECMPSKKNSEIEMFCHHYLSANDDIMLMCGQQSAAIFDGEFWLPFAPNGPVSGDF